LLHGHSDELILLSRGRQVVGCVVVVLRLVLVGANLILTMYLALILVGKVALMPTPTKTTPRRICSLAIGTVLVLVIILGELLLVHLMWEIPLRCLIISTIGIIASVRATKVTATHLLTVPACAIASAIVHAHVHSSHSVHVHPLSSESSEHSLRHRTHVHARYALISISLKPF
jgi:hypothetical protein